MQSSSQITEAWNSLVAVALLGTERRPATLPNMEGALGSLLAQLGDSTGGERTLLGAAALLTAYKGAGRQRAGVGTSPMPAPSEPEERPYCTPRAEAHLALMLGGQHADILPEWLCALVKCGRLVPPEHITALLDLGISQTHLRDDITRATGKRGQWLARQNPQWAYLAVEEADPAGWQATWETGSFEVRRALLRHMRRSDPGRARELMSLTWKEDKAQERSAFLVELQTGLSMDDEPVLEAALDDRSQDVRGQAAGLLAQLPESGLVQRTIEVVLPLISFKEMRRRRLLGGTDDKSYIEVALPQDYTTQMKRDGVQQKPLNTRTGERAYWLSQMLGRIPPSFWNRQWGVSAEGIIAATENTKEWRDLLMGAWLEATERHKDEGWARAFLAHGPAGWTEGAAQHLLPALPGGEREAFLIGVLGRNLAALYTAAMPAAVLWRLETPWSMELSRLLLRSASHYIAPADGHGNWQVLNSLQGFARFMPPAILEEATEALLNRAANNTFFTDGVDEFLATLQFRRDMIKELD